MSGVMGGLTVRMGRTSATARSTSIWTSLSELVQLYGTALNQSMSMLLYEESPIIISLSSVLTSSMTVAMAIVLKNGGGLSLFICKYVFASFFVFVYLLHNVNVCDHWRCDRRPDCADGSDERGCQGCRRDGQIMIVIIVIIRQGSDMLRDLRA